MMMPETPPPLKPSPEGKSIYPSKTKDTGPIFAFATLFLAGISVSLLIFVLYIGTKDLESPPDDSFIQRHAREVPDGENAYKFYLDAIVASSLLYGEYEELMAAEENGVGYDELRKNIITKNASALSLIESAANAPLSQAPIENTFTEETALDHSDVRRLNVILRIYQRTLLGKGRYQEALDHSVRLAELGCRLTASNSGTIYYLQAVSTERSALITFQEILYQVSLSTEELEVYIDKLSKLHDDGAVLSQALSEEYFFWNRAIAEFFSGFSTSNDSALHRIFTLIPRDSKTRGFYFHPHRTRALLLELFEPLIEDASLPYSKMRLAPMRAATALSSPSISTIFTPNWVSEGMIQRLYPGLLRTLEVKCRLNSEIAACQTLVALKCYQNDNGTSAENLEDLVPRYLPNLPLDDYNGARLLYDPERRILYSVGRDLVDDGGDESSDIVWAIGGASAGPP